jgi:hypothetical protein
VMMEFGAMVSCAILTFLGLWCAQLLLINVVSLTPGDETCNAMNVCQFGTQRKCSDGLSCTDDICNESDDSCENPIIDCLLSDDPCATDQCVESLGGCQFSCGATLETWTGINGDTIVDLMSGTNNLENTPSRTEHLGQLLEAPSNTDDYYGSRMKGWLIPPVTGEYVFWIASDDQGELFLSSNDHPENKVRVCFAPSPTEGSHWTGDLYQRSTLIPLVAGYAYYFEVSIAIFLAVLHVRVLSLYRSHYPLFVHEV